MVFYLRTCVMLAQQKSTDCTALWFYVWGKITFFYEFKLWFVFLCHFCLRMVPAPCKLGRVHCLAALRAVRWADYNTSWNFSRDLVQRVDAAVVLQYWDANVVLHFNVLLTAEARGSTPYKLYECIPVAVKIFEIIMILLCFV